MLNKKIRSALVVYTRPGLSKFFSASSTTMELLPLKELDFGLQKRTSGVVASSFGLPRIGMPRSEFS